jgi:SNF2 family DNA or RNA helicase
MGEMKLHNYQQRIVDFCLNNSNIILAVGMGLGKTASVLHYLSVSKPSTCIIVAPKRVAETVWKQEAKKWGLDDVYNKMVIVAGNPTTRKNQLFDTEHPYKIISRDNIKDIVNYSCDVLILDELTSFKNHLSKRSLACYSIKAKQRIGLTGTLIANGAIDIYGQMLASGIGDISSEQKIKSNFFRWRSSYFIDKLAGSGLQWNKWVLNCHLDVLLQPIKKYIFTLSSEDWLDIPEVECIVNEVELSNKEMNEYLSLQSMLHLELDGEHYSVSEGAKFAKLQTLCNGFIYQTETGEAIRSEYSTKLDAVAEFCDRAVNEGERVLLFYASPEEAIWLSEKFKELGIKFCSPKDKRWLQKFETGEIDVLISHPASIGHGTNLQHCSRICVWSTITYNYEYWAQSNARLARQGQNKNVQIHSFISKGTIEKNKYLALMKKSKEDKLFINLTK